ncbi:MAG: TerC family protein [Planctomycetia bacterium]|jgi:tellurite resistance protein TerC
MDAMLGENMLIWGLFAAVVTGVMALDLGVFNKKAHEPSVKEALAWTGVWVVLALLFNAFVWWHVDPRFLAEHPGKSDHLPSFEFLTCWLTEYALSVDNIFVFLVVFSYFGIPAQSRHRVLFWGILGAALMRGLFLWIGVEALERFHWLIWVLGGLLVLTGFKLMFQKEDGDVDPGRNPVLKLVRRFVPVTTRFDGERFFTTENGRKAATPLFLCLMVIETTDILFALDSVPAALGISQNLFVVYTSNIFAILGLRSLFFAVGGLLRYLHYLKYGLSLILVFVGIKMLLPEEHKIPIGAALGVVAGILALATIASIVRAKVVAEDEQGA